MSDRFNEMALMLLNKTKNRNIKRLCGLNRLPYEMYGEFVINVLMSFHLNVLIFMPDVLTRGVSFERAQPNTGMGHYCKTHKKVTSDTF